MRIPNVLLVDFFWPNRLAKWRIVNVESFSDHLKADILVINSDVFFELPNTDEDFKTEIFKNRDEYDILIFDHRFNWMNKYNTRIDGTDWNVIGNHLGFYLFRHKSKPLLSDPKSNEFILQYDVYYHIFLCIFTHFWSRVNQFPSQYNAKYAQRHWIHLYPGGGVTNPSFIKQLPPLINIITTQNYISNMCQLQYTINHLKLGFAPVMLESEENDQLLSLSKTYQKNGQLRLCFTTLGNLYFKGYTIFKNLAHLASQKFGKEKFRFIAVGNIKESDDIIERKGILSQPDLHKFYYEDVDIYINGDNGVEYNGWPLGTEALLAGCLLITTDIHQENCHYFNFTPDEMLIITPTNCELIILDFLEDILTNKRNIKQMVLSAEQKFRQLGSFTKTMLPIINSIKNVNNVEPVIEENLEWMHGKIAIFSEDIKQYLNNYKNIEIWMPDGDINLFLSCAYSIAMARDMFTCTGCIISKNQQLAIFQAILMFIEPNGYIILEGDGTEICQKIDQNSYICNFEIVKLNSSIRLKKLCPSSINFGIVMATYKRNDGSTPSKISESLASINKQTYKNYKVFLIGDKYTDNIEFESFKQYLPPEKLEVENLPIAWERDNCKIRANLWTVGGAHAMNQGLRKIRHQNIRYYCHLDDDDYWHPNHLYNIACVYEKFKVDFVTTLGILGDHILPHYNGFHINNYIPRGGTCFHSSQSWNIDTIPFEYTTVSDFSQEQQMPPADSQMLSQIGESVRKNLIKSFVIQFISCFRKTEGDNRIV